MTSILFSKRFSGWEGGPASICCVINIRKYSGNQRIGGIYLSLWLSRKVFWKNLGVSICKISSVVQFSSLSHVQLFVTLWTAACQAFHHQLPKLTQTHVHWVSDTIQPSHPLSSPSSPARNTSHHQSLFQWVNSSHEVAKVLEFQL